MIVSESEYALRNIINVPAYVYMYYVCKYINTYVCAFGETVINSCHMHDRGHRLLASLFDFQNSEEPGSKSREW